MLNGWGGLKPTFPPRCPTRPCHSLRPSSSRAPQPPLQAPRGKQTSTSPSDLLHSPPFLAPRVGPRPHITNQKTREKKRPPVSQATELPAAATVDLRPGLTLQGASIERPTSSVTSRLHEHAPDLPRLCTITRPQVTRMSPT
ncbi:hypothetical protein NDU88_001987 [Pleurodeles waltl]|uniref:Uncharacterized protein n=1 Tax=Pleurodeles waltl TaxID=8319 RepID=A0AAV7LET9_PLEWA|nr:hypothetical protein NDU88_001987 [Pleurodeles waltl]